MKKLLDRAAEEIAVLASQAGVFMFALAALQHRKPKDDQR